MEQAVEGGFPDRSDEAAERGPDLSSAGRDPSVLDRGRSILLSVGGVTLILFLVKITGFGERMVVARYLGTSRSADCYQAAFSVIWAIVFIVRGLVQPACLPVYLQAAESGGAAAAHRVFSALAALLTALLVPVAVGIAVWPGAIIRLVVPGFDPDAQAEAGTLLRAMSAGIVLLTLMGFTTTMLNAHQRFCWAAVGDLVFRCVLLVGLVAGFSLWGQNQVGLWLGVGAVVGLTVHGAVLSRHTRLCRPVIDQQTSSALRQMALLAAPLVVGVMASQVSRLIDGMLASTLSAGRLAALGYAKKLIDAIVLMGPVALSTIMFARFSALVAAGRVDQMRSTLVRCVRVLLVASVPVAILVVTLRYPIVRVLFQQGQFGADSTELTAAALACYGIGIVALAVEALLGGAFYAMKDMNTPVIVGIVCVALDISLAFALMRPLDHAGIALALSIAKTVKVVILGILLHRRLALGVSREVLILLAALAVAGAGMVLCILVSNSMWDTAFPSPTGKVMELTRAVVLGVVGCAAFFAFGRVCGVAELRELVQAVCRRLGRDHQRPDGDVLEEHTVAVRVTKARVDAADRAPPAA